MLCAAVAIVAPGVIAAPLPQNEASKNGPQAPAQPIPFSHKTHISAAHLTCEDCHAGPDPGEHMTMPTVSKCMACHISIAKDKPAIRALSEYAKTKEPIKWLRVYTVPADVFWSHRSHLKAGATCETCHGQVAQMEVLARATNVTSMEGCVDCHKQHEANTGCDFCHEDK